MAHRPPLGVLLLGLAAHAAAGTVRVEVVPELGQVGASPVAGAIVPLQITPTSLIAAIPLAAPAPALTPAALVPTIALAPLPTALAKPAPPVAQAEGRPLVIKTLAAPALDVSKLGAGESSAAIEKDFNARAQLDAPAALTGAVSAPAAEFKPVSKGRLTLVRSAKTPATSRLAAVEGKFRDGDAMRAALRALDGAAAGAVLPLEFAPAPADLKVLGELPYEVFLHRRRSDGRWLMARGDRHGVSGEWEEYDLALHNHPEARLGAYSMHSEYPSPEDLETSAGKNARFFVITKGGVVEWNSTVPKDVTAALTDNFFGRFVMRIAFPALYPTLLARRGVAVEQRPWRKVTREWLENGEAPLNEAVLLAKTIPAFIAEEFPIIAAKLGRKVDAAYAADVLKRSNGYRMYWHSATTYKDHPDHVGIPDGHFRRDFGIRLMIKPDWRKLKDLSANFRPLYAHEYTHWLQDEGLVSTKYGGEIAAVAVEVLRAIELIGLDAVRDGRAGTVHAGNFAAFESGRAWARGGFKADTMPYSKGVLAGAAYEAGVVTGRPEAAWEYLNLVIAGKNAPHAALEPQDAWKTVTGAK